MDNKNINIDNILLKMHTKCINCEHDNLDHLIGKRDEEVSKVGVCCIEGCECKHFINKE